MTLVTTWLAWSTAPLIAHAEEWKLQRTGRWQRIATRLESILLRRPREGYALRRLLKHYRQRRRVGVLIQKFQQKQLAAPKNLRIAQALALLYLQTKRKSQAERQLRALLRRKLSKSQRQRVQFWLGRLAFRSAQWDEAQQLFQALLAQNPSRKRKRQLQRQLLQLAQQRRRWPQAIRYARQMLKDDPRNVPLRLDLARFLSQNDKHAEAAAQLTIAQKRVPLSQRPQMWRQIAKFHLKANDTRRALKAVAQAQRKLAPNHWMHRELMAMEEKIHRQQGTLLLLLQQYQKRSKRAPQRYWPAIASLQASLGQWKQAIVTYRALLKRYPRHPALTKAVSLLLTNKRPVQARRLLEQRLQRLPKDGESRLLLIQTLHALVLQDDRDDQMQELAKRHPKDVRLLRKLVIAFNKWSIPYVQQLPFHRQLCKLKPPRASCYQRWGELLWVNRKHRKAWEVWDKIKDIDPPSASALYLLYELYRDRGRFRESTRILKRLLRLQPRHLNAQLSLATNWYRKKRYIKAIKVYRLVLRESSQSKLREKAKVGLFQSMFRQYGFRQSEQLLRRDYLTAPFTSAPLHLLLRFYQNNRQTRQARALLQENLSLYPNDYEFQQSGAALYENDIRALPFLKNAIRLKRSYDSAMLKSLRQQLYNFNRRKEYLAFVKALTKRWPQSSKAWFVYAEEASLQKASKAALDAYRQALQLSPRTPRYSIGLARHISKTQPTRALDILYKPPFPKNKKQWLPWISLILDISRAQKVSFAAVLTRIQSHFSKPEETLLQILIWLQQKRLELPRAEHQALRRALQSKGAALWYNVATRHPEPRFRLQAMTFLAHSPQGLSVALLRQLLQDNSPTIRGYALVHLALKNNPKHYLWIDHLERRDKDSGVRYAAKLAGAWLAKSFETSTYLPALRWEWLHPPIVAMLRERPSLDGLLVLSRLYSRCYSLTRVAIIRSLFRYPVPLLKQMHKQMNTPTGRWRSKQNRCFALFALHYMAGGDKVPAKLIQLARTLKPKDRALRARCGYYHYIRRQPLYSLPGRRFGQWRGRGHRKRWHAQGQRWRRRGRGWRRQYRMRRLQLKYYRTRYPRRHRFMHPRYHRPVVRTKRRTFWIGGFGPRLTQK